MQIQEVMKYMHRERNKKKTNPQAPIPALRKDNFLKNKILFLLSYEYNMFLMRHE